MGSKLSRSSTARSEGPKSRWKRGKRKDAERTESPADTEKFPHPNNHVRESSDANLNDSYEKWSKRTGQQDVVNYNVDPPGAPSTYPAAYQMAQNDPHDQTWSSPHDLTNHFYQGGSLPIAPTSGVVYDMNHYIPASVNGQSQQIVPEERSSKNLKFTRAMQQQQSHPHPRNALTNTHSWHESSNNTNEMSNSLIRQEPIPNRTSARRTMASTAPSSNAQATIQKPIYVGIDHKATLAERGQTTIHRRHHKSSDRGSSDTSASTTNNHRTRSHTHHHHKHQDVNDNATSKATMKSNRSFDRLQAKLSGSNLPVTATSTIIANKQAEQPVFNHVEIRAPKSRGSRHAQPQHVEHQTLADNETRPSKSRASQSHAKQQQPQPSQPQRSTGSRNDSPLRTEPSRRVNNKHHNAPLMKINIAQPQRQTQGGTTGAVATPPTISRTRV